LINICLTLLRGRCNWRTETDSLRRPTKRAFWVGVAEARSEGREDLRFHCLVEGKEIGMEGSKEEEEEAIH